LTGKGPGYYFAGQGHTPKQETAQVGREAGAGLSGIHMYISYRLLRNIAGFDKLPGLGIFLGRDNLAIRHRKPCAGLLWLQPAGV